MTSAAAKFKSNIYPEYCHILSPTIGKWCPLLATDVHALVHVGMYHAGTGRQLLHFGNHPVKWVRLTGVIVAINEWGNENNWKRVYTLDDSSGSCIDCTAIAPFSYFKKENESRHKVVGCTSNNQPDDINPKEQNSAVAPPSVLAPSIPWLEVDIGTIVKVKGKVDIWWNHKRIEVVKLEVMKSTEMELKCWNEVREFRRDLLNKPWELTEKQERKCRKRKERKMVTRGKMKSFKGK